MKLKIFIIIVLSVTISSCSIFQDKNLAKRYRNHSNLRTFGNSVDPELFVQVDLNSALILKPKGEKIKYNILTLSEKGQEAFINSANSKSTTGQELINLLNTNFSFNKSKTSKIKIIPKTLKKTLIFTVDRLQYHYNPKNSLTTFNTLGDRISYLELSLKISNQSNAIFNSWDKYVTDKITLNLGKVTSAQNWNATLSANAKGTAGVSLTGSNTQEDFSSNKDASSILLNTGNDSSNSNSYELLTSDKETGNNTNSINSSGEFGGSASVGYSDKYETTLDLTSQILKLSGSLSDNRVLLRQESGPGIDLSGNIVVSIEYKITDDWAKPVEFSKISNLYSSSGAPNTVTSIKKSFIMVMFPDIKQDITGQLDYSFLYRQVNKGNRHIPESRQKVKFRYGSVFSKDNPLITDPNGLVDLVKKDDIRPKAYFIKLLGNKTLELHNEILTFETVSEAAVFLAYAKDLVSHSVPVTGLTLNGNPINPSDIKNLQIVTIQL